MMMELEYVTVSCLVLGITLLRHVLVTTDKQTTKNQGEKKKTHFVHKTCDMHMQA